MRVHVCTRDGRGAHGQGTNACYTLCRCRCYPCATAGTEYRRQRDRQNQWGQSLTVDAEPVRQHVRSLMCSGRRGSHHKGVGLKRIVVVSGVSQGALWKLMYGRDGKPSKRVRRDTADKLLAVTADHMADGASIPAGPTRRKLDEMVEGGFAKAELGRFLTGDYRTMSLQVARGRRVSVKHARRVDDLYRRWKADEIVPRGRRSRHEYGPPAVTPATPPPVGFVRRDCIDCGAPSLGGGLRCLPCFNDNADPRSAPSADVRCGTYSGYARHGHVGERPCERCREAKAKYVQGKKVAA